MALHRECPAFDIMAAAGAEEEDVKLLTGQEGEWNEGEKKEKPQTLNPKPRIVDLFPFTRRVQFFRKLLGEVSMINPKP